MLAYAGRGQEDGRPFIRLAGNNAAIAGLVISYPEWKQTDVPPVPYPPCVMAEHAENVGVHDCLFLNPYEAIKLVRAAPAIWVRNVTGYPIKRGIFVDECYDIGHIENVHFWPFGVRYQPDDPYCQWINTQGVAFELARTDWHYVFNTFCFGYGIGYKFSESKAGSTNGNFLGLGSRLLPAGRGRRPGAAAGPADHQRRIRRAAGAAGLGLPGGRPAGRRQGQPGQLLLLGADRPLRLDAQSRAGSSPPAPATSSTGTFAPSGLPPSNSTPAGPSSKAAPLPRRDRTWPSPQPVASALLVGNQASGGFEAESLAGKRTQLSANESSPVEWTAEAKKHYRVAVGAEGDGRYLRLWHGREGTARWSADKSMLRLPTLPREPYTLTLTLDIPQAALSEEAGLYLDGKRIASFQAGSADLIAELPPSQAEQVVLSVVCAGWVPALLNHASQDQRKLGVQLSQITMRTKNPGPGVFQANTGQWQE